MTQLKLVQVPQGAEFEWEGKVLVHDIVGRSGGGQVAVREKATGKPLKLQGTTLVNVLDGDEPEVPVVLTDGDDTVVSEEDVFISPNPEAEAVVVEANDTAKEAEGNDDDTEVEDDSDEEKEVEAD